MTMSEDEIAFRRSILDLQRLLHCMEHGEEEGLSSHSILLRAEMAQGLYLQIHEKCVERNLNESMLGDFPQRIKQACRRARDVAAKKKKENGEIDWVEQIFFPPKEHKASSELELSASEIPVSSNNTPGPGHGHVAPPKQQKQPKQQLQQQQEQPEQSIQEIQAAQRAQLEEEISHMAAQLKTSTLRMNQSLKTQTQELDEMGLLAEQNVVQVGQAAENVNIHLKRSWGSTIASWTMIATVFGTFILAMVIMRMIPKRKNLCFPFFCKNQIATATGLKANEQPWEAPCLLYCDYIPEFLGVEVMRGCHSISTMMRHKFLCPSHGQVDHNDARGWQILDKTHEEMSHRRSDAVQDPGDERSQGDACADDSCDAGSLYPDRVPIRNEASDRTDDSALHERSGLYDSVEQQVRNQREMMGDGKDEEISGTKREEWRSDVASPDRDDTSPDHTHIERAALVPEDTQARTEVQIDVVTAHKGETPSENHREHETIESELQLSGSLTPDHNIEMQYNHQHTDVDDDATGEFQHEETAFDESHYVEPEVAPEVSSTGEEIHSNVGASQEAGLEPSVREDAKDYSLAQQFNQKRSTMGDDSIESKLERQHYHALEGYKSSSDDISVHENIRGYDGVEIGGYDNQGTSKVHNDVATSHDERTRHGEERERDPIHVEFAELNVDGESQGVNEPKPGYSDNYNEQRYPEPHGAVEGDASQVILDVSAGSYEARNDVATIREEESQSGMMHEKLSPLGEPDEGTNGDPQLQFSRRDVSMAAVACDIDLLRQYVEKQPEYVVIPDENGWTTFTETVASGCWEGALLLIEMVPNLDVNHLTSNGATALWWAEQQGFSRNHPIIELIEARGGIIAGP